MYGTMNIKSKRKGFGYLEGPIMGVWFNIRNTDLVNSTNRTDNVHITYNVTLRRVHATIVMEKQRVLNNLIVSVALDI
jgi:hypothetical protein